MKARKVKGLDPDGPLSQNAVRIAHTRIDDMYQLAAKALDPDDVTALHNTRIAAKRLRYLLELMEPCLGKPAGRAAKRAKSLQTLLGEIHDCDEMLPLVRARVKRLRSEDAAAVRAEAGERAGDVAPEAARSAPNRTHYRGLESLHAYLQARRQVLYARFVREWSAIEREGFRERLVAELDAAADSIGAEGMQASRA
jgi:CHAD domain-containing protein